MFNDDFATRLKNSGLPTYWNDIYRIDYVFFDLANKDVLVNILDRGDRPTFSDEDGGVCWHWRIDGGRYVFVGVLGDKGDYHSTLSILSHEIYHAVSATAILTGMRLDAENDEAQAYLYQTLFYQGLKATEKLFHGELLFLPQEAGS